MKRLSSPSPWLLALAGCGVVCVPAHGDGAEPTMQRAATKATPDAGPQWNRSAATKHNGSGIRLEYSVPTTFSPGRTGTVQLRFSGVTADDARVEWRAPAGGSVSSAALGAATSLALPRGEVTTVLLDVTPAADGMAYLDVFTSQGGRTSAQSVPLKVGSGAVSLKRDGTMQTMPLGEKVISLPSTPK